MSRTRLDQLRQKFRQDLQTELSFTESSTIPFFADQWRAARLVHRVSQHFA